LARLRDELGRLDLRSTIETGARFLLDPRHKHQPTLVSPVAADRVRRVDFLLRAIDAAAFLGSEVVSLWSGAPTDAVDLDAGLDRLAAALAPVLAHAAACGVTLGFEPEPGMLIDTLDAFERLLARVDAPQLQLTLDVGHLWCQRELPIAERIARAGPRIVNVHLEDMRAGVHEHLMFGEGEMDFDTVFAALVAAGYRGPVHVELSRHSHMAPQAARQAYAFLRPRLEAARCRLQNQASAHLSPKGARAGGGRGVQGP
jgi:sugar phosphate isomerase/epimerase